MYMIATVTRLIRKHFKTLIVKVKSPWKVEGMCFFFLPSKISQFYCLKLDPDLFLFCNFKVLRGGARTVNKKSISVTISFVQLLSTSKLDDCN